jgi:hypothetical protein
VADRYLKIAGDKFRTTSAFSAPLFCLGVINTKGANHFDPKGEPEITDHPVKIWTNYQTAETKSASLNVLVKAGIDAAKGGLNLKREGEEDKEGIFAVIRDIEIYKLIRKLNALVNEELLRQLKDEKYPVVITSVAIVTRVCSQ